MVVASVAPCRKPVEMKSGVVRWEDFARLEPPRVRAEFVARLGLREAKKFLDEEIEKLFSDGELPTSPGDSLRIELAIQRVFAQAGDRVFHCLVEGVHQGEEFVEYSVDVAMSQPKPKVYREGDRDVTLTFLGGSKLSVLTPYILAGRRGGGGPPRTKRGKEGNGSYPVLRRLGFLDGVSPGLIAEIGYRVGNSSFDEAQMDFERRGIHLNFKTVRTLGLALAGQGLEARVHHARLPCSSPEASGARASPIPVGTPLSGRPPDRSVRAVLTSPAPTLGSGVEAAQRPGMQDLGVREPAAGHRIKTVPVQSGSLAAALKRTEP